MDLEIAFLVSASTLAFVVSLAMISSMGASALDKRSGDPALALYLRFVHAALVGVLVLISSNVFTELSYGTLIIGTIVFLVAVPLLVTYLSLVRRMRLPKNLDLAGWICGFLLIVLIVVRYQLRN